MGRKGRNGAPLKVPTVLGAPQMQSRARDEPSPRSPTDAAIYIATLAGELAQMARGHGFESLSYILEMARLEADQVVKASGKGGNDGP